MIKQKFYKDQNDHIYLNCSLYNNTNEDIIAQYSTTFNSPIIDGEMNDYEFCIVRFSIPNTIPIFIFDDNTYYITLTYLGTDFQVPLIYNRHDFTTSDKVINNFQHFVDIVNTGFQTAFNNMKGTYPAAPQTIAPQMVYNYTPTTFSIYFENTYDSPNIQVFFNTALYRFFYDTYKVITYSVNSATRKDVQFIVTDEVNNNLPPNIYEVRQFTNTVYQFYDLQTIFFRTNIHINPEMITSIDNVNNNNIEIPIITDFKVDFSTNDRSEFIYDAQIYRFCDCMGSQKLYKFDFSVNYFNRKGQAFLYKLAPSNYISVKFLFRKRK